MSAIAVAIRRDRGQCLEPARRERLLCLGLVLVIESFQDFPRKVVDPELDWPDPFVQIKIQDHPILP